MLGIGGRRPPGGAKRRKPALGHGVFAALAAMLGLGFETKCQIGRA